VFKQSNLIYSLAKKLSFDLFEAYLLQYPFDRTCPFSWRFHVSTHLVFVASWVECPRPTRRLHR